MKRLAWVAAVASVTLFASASAWAELCGKCRDRAYIMSVGQCVECGGYAGSGAFKLCGKCSERLNQCEHCRGPLKPVAVQPPPPPASQPADSPPAAQPSPAAQEKARQLKAAVDELVFEFHHVGPADKPFYKLTLSVPDFMLDEPKPFDLVERIAAAQAEKIIDRLLQGGWLDRAQAIGANWGQLVELKSRGYVLRMTAGKLAMAVDLGWDLKMLRLLDAVRAAVKGEAADGDAAAAVDKLLARMSGLRQAWEAAEPPPPASQPESPGPARTRIEIRIGADGALQLDGQPVADIRQLADRLAGKEGIVILRADRQVEWQRVMAVFNAAVAAGCKDVQLAAPWKP